MGEHLRNRLKCPFLGNSSINLIRNPYIKQPFSVIPHKNQNQILTTLQIIIFYSTKKMKIAFLFSIFTLATPISIFIGRETEITSEKAFVLGRMKVTVIAKETPGKRGFVFIKQLDDEWKIKWTECTQELRSQVSTGPGTTGPNRSEIFKILLVLVRDF